MSAREFFVMAWLLGASLALAFWVLPEAWRDMRQDEPFVGGCFVVAGATMLLCFVALFGGLAWWMATR